MELEKKQQQKMTLTDRKTNNFSNVDLQENKNYYLDREKD